MEKGRDKRIVSVLMTLTIIFTLMGGTLSYLRWQTSEAQKTNVVFTVNQDFSCAADGGGNIQSATLMPASCTNPKYAIQRTVTVTPTIKKDDLSINMDLWLDINVLGSGLSQSEYFKYALTTEENSCTTGIISQGRFTGLSAENNDKVMLLNQQEYSTSEPQTYYLYIWIDPLEENNYILEQPFNFSLGGSCTDNPEVKPSKPELDPGMIPVTISDTGVVTTISENDGNWYDYENKEWANVVLVNSSSRSTYLNTTGKTVSNNDILAYYVWIPRYKYRMQKKCSMISNPTIEQYPECYSIVLSSEEDKSNLIQGVYYLALQQGYTSYTMADAQKEVEEGLTTGIFNSSTLGFVNETMVSMMELYNSMSGTSLTYTTQFQPGNKILTNIPRLIDILFESTSSEKSTGDAINTYRTHPAFTFGTTELNGIWVGKFETTGDATTPTIKPNMRSLVSKNVSTQFTTSLKFAGGTQTGSLVSFTGSNTYGLTNKTDSHMMKNSEWGAVAYLSHSKYGINEEIRINNYYNSGTLTGCGASTPNEAEASTCGIPYGTPSSETNTYSQSTTGNITGVFDMSGGVWEYVMGNYNGTTNSYFTTLPDAKYYDKYTVTSMKECTLTECGGHALNETYRWYLDTESFVGVNVPWFYRGGHYNYDTGAGAFGSGVNDGYAAGSGYGFRAVLVKGA